MHVHSRAAALARVFRIAFGGALLSALVAAPRAAAPNKACALAAPAELQSVLGSTVAGLKGSEPMPGVAICSGQTAGASVMLRVSKIRGKGSEEAAAKGIEMAKQMGVTVEVKSFGPITCSTMIPPANLAQYGYNTTCSVTKAGDVAAIEVTAKTRKDMVSIETLRPLAEKFAQRF
jgi:hypothetical protein